MQLSESQACDIDSFRIRDDAGGKSRRICGIAEAGEWRSDTSGVSIEFASAPESEVGSPSILGSGFSITLSSEPVHPVSTSDYGALSWSLGTTSCAFACPSKFVLTNQLSVALGSILNIPTWRVHVPSVTFSPNPVRGQPEITSVTVQIVPDYSASFVPPGTRRQLSVHSVGARAYAADDGSAWAPLDELYRQLTVPESQRHKEAVWTNSITADSEPATLSIAFESPPKAAFRPQMLVFQVKASELGQACSANTKTVEQTFNIANSGPIGSHLAVGGIRFTSPFVTAVKLTFKTTAQGSSIAAGDEAEVKALLLACSVPEGTVDSVFGTITVETSDISGDRDVFVRVDITDVPGPTPSASPTVQPSSPPQAAGDIDWMAPSMLMAAGVGAGSCLIFGVLSYCCCSRLCSGKKKPTAADRFSAAASANGSGSGPAKPSGSSSAGSRGGSGVLNGQDEDDEDGDRDGDGDGDDGDRRRRGSGRGNEDRGRGSRSRGDGKGRGGRRRSRSDDGDDYDDREDDDGVELTGVRLGRGSGRKDDREDAEDAFSSLTVPQPASGSAWQPPSLRESSATPSNRGSSSSSRGDSRAWGGSSASAAVSTFSSSGSSSSMRPTLSLDRSATLAADAFEGRWAGATESDFMGGSLTPAAAASPESIESALKAAGVVCIASGEVGGVQKQFFFAKQTGSGRLFMAEVSVTKQSRHLSAMVRAEEPTGPRGSGADLAQFVKILDLALKPLFE
jgi:hypothetical protein